MTKTHWKKTFNKDFLGAWDFDVPEINTVIKEVVIKTVKDVNGNENKCNVAVLKGLKPMILNVTNCQVVEKFAKSKFIEDWNNIPVTLYIDPKVKAFGTITEGVRIKSKQPSLKKPVLTQGTPAWEGALKFVEGGGDVTKITEKYDVGQAELEALHSRSK